jgi:hypothetical protein
MTYVPSKTSERPLGSAIGEVNATVEEEASKSGCRSDRGPLLWKLFSQCIGKLRPATR